MAGLFGLLVVVLVLCGPASAATHYVDPAAGNNDNAGTSAAAPWQNPPGTRTANDSGFWSAAWGSITTSNRVRCGDLILLRGGNTQANTQGGAWRLNASYYTTGCTGTTGEGGGSNRITIRVATNAEWPGSTGPFTLDGTSVTPTNPNGDFAALVFLDDAVHSLTVGGVSASQRLIVRNSTAMGVTNWDNEGGTARFRGQWLELINNARGGFEIGSADHWVVHDTLAHDNGQCGLCVGLSSNWANSNGAFVDVEVYNNGAGAGNGHHDGIFMINTSSMWVIRAKAHDNWERGMDSGAGEKGTGPNQIYRYRDVEAWDNGRGFPDGTGAGVQLSGQRALAPPPTVYAFLVRGRFYRNAGPGFGGYERLILEGWHIVSHRNGHRSGDTNLWHDVGIQRFLLRNSIFLARGAGVWGSGTSDQDDNVPPQSDFNLYDFNAAQTENFSSFRYVRTTFSTNPVTFQNAASQSGFTGTHDRISTSGTNYDADFTSLGGNCDAGDFVYEDCDFTLRPTSDAVDMGQFLMRANGDGRSATTVNVLGNGSTNDPRSYFIQPSSYLGAVGDLIEIEGCGEVTITSMSATSITFSPACSWSDGAGIHFPWNGSAPDMGAFERGASDAHERKP